MQGQSIPYWMDEYGSYVKYINTLCRCGDQKHCGQSCLECDNCTECECSDCKQSQGNM